MYTIEFQKRGLPHAHILLWLHPKDKINTPQKIDSVICAELPDKDHFPKLYSVVTNFMIHVSCGDKMKSCPCMVNGRCSKYYPKKFTSSTSFDEKGYPVYKRRNTGATVIKKNKN